MTFISGTKLGPYEILSPLGAGGMGEVYRARDPRIGRDIAIKILPQAYSEDPDRLRRFELEARAAGGLNHPGILAIYDVGTQDDTPYLVSELLEGETLREKLRTGPLPQRKSIEYAIQLAQALAAAHDKGIAHRDLKPENILITSDGRVKILDFGLAKLIHPEKSGDQVSMLQTGAPESQPGMVLGTMGYMSPEQVRGQPSDHRSDIFTFGTILYEMLSGNRAFHGGTAADTISAILHKDPPEITGGQSSLSPAANRIIRHCLEKNPNERFQSMRDIAFDLESLTGLSGTVTTSPVPSSPVRNISAWLHRGLTAVLALLLLFLAIRYFLRPAQIAPMIRFSLDTPQDPAKADNTVVPLQLAVSPDGSQLVFVCPDKGTQNVLWLRPLSSMNAQSLQGTDNAIYPFWSTDARYVGFFASGKLKKIDVRTGSVQVICDAPAGRGGAWNSDGNILFAPDKLGGLYQVSAEGGEPKLVTDDRAKEAITYRWPMFLPDYDHFVYLQQWASGATGTVNIGSLHSKDRKLLMNANSNVAYVSPGYLLFYRDGKLMGQKFDWKRQTLSGEVFSVSPDQLAYNQARGFTTFSASYNGVISYQPDRVTPSSLIWLDRSGKQTGTAGEPGFFSNARLSPDGKRIVVIRHETHTEEGDIWLLDLEKNNLSRFTFKPDIYSSPTWTPDGKGILFGGVNIFRKDSSGTGNESLIFKSLFSKNPTSITRDGKYVAVSVDNAKTQQDLWILPLSGAAPYAFLNAAYNENYGQFSPDGRWLAYASDESGKSEIYVRPFPAKDAGKWQVSTSGGILPVWRADGKELYFVSSQNMLMAAEIKASDTFDSGTPQALFQMPLITITDDTLYDVTTDGQRFIMTNQPGKVFRPSISVVVNWAPDLKNSER